MVLIIVCIAGIISICLFLVIFRALDNQVLKEKFNPPPVVKKAVEESPKLRITTDKFVIVNSLRTRLHIHGKVRWQ